MILVDTSIWIDHLRKGKPELAALLYDGAVLSHPFVIGELACGNLKNREEILGLFSALPASPTASHHEALELVDRRELFGKGIGWIDVHLLASALLANCKLWTKDRRLAAIATSLDITYP